ncbi:hypothetical protein PVAG01_10645 [Phlyctema vagabunda]|uniref:Uncharacterized protein n=1 Tax=Phlyctema vagabunda TaxID=108571 RepID=A0ABR4P2T3_9HELO
MPSLMVQTSPPKSNQSASQSHSPHSPKTRYSSPTRPPHSPITPVLEPAKPVSSTSQNGLPPTTKTYTHSSQQPQKAIVQPPPQVIDFDTNPDAIALKASISILQMQRRNAENDIKELQQTKQRALVDTAGFVKALTSGKIAHKSDTLFVPTESGSDDDEDEDEEEDMKDVDSGLEKGTPKEDSKPWPQLPKPQNVVRQPVINWNQYGVVGDSLDKLHADQQARPTEGMPQRLGADGAFVFGGDGPRRPANLGIAAPYTPGRDRIEKSAKKSGKR